MHHYFFGLGDGLLPSERVKLWFYSWVGCGYRVQIVCSDSESDTVMQSCVQLYSHVVVDTSGWQMFCKEPDWCPLFVSVVGMKTCICLLSTIGPPLPCSLLNRPLICVAGHCNVITGNKRAICTEEQKLSLSNKRGTKISFPCLKKQKKYWRGRRLLWKGKATFMLCGSFPKPQ